MVKLKTIYPNIAIIHNHNDTIIQIDEIEILITTNHVHVLENKQRWPSYITPKYNQDLLVMVDEVMLIKKQQDENNSQVKELKKSLEAYFDCVIYNPYHKTFIINCQQGLIMIGTHKITMYCNGDMIDKPFDSNITGKMIYDVIKND